MNRLIKLATPVLIAAALSGCVITSASVGYQDPYYVRPYYVRPAPIYYTPPPAVYVPRPIYIAPGHHHPYRHPHRHYRR